MRKALVEFFPMVPFPLSVARLYDEKSISYKEILWREVSFFVDLLEKNTLIMADLRFDV